MIKQYWNQLRLRSADWKLSGITSRFDGLRGSTIFETFAVLCCFEQHLVLSSIKASQSSMQVEDCLSIDLPSHLIGDVRVEDLLREHIVALLSDVLLRTNRLVLVQNGVEEEVVERLREVVSRDLDHALLRCRFLGFGLGQRQRT